MKRTSIFQSKNYRNVLLKYKKLHTRIVNLVRGGEFQNLSRIEQKSMVSRFKLLYKRLTKMQPGYGIKTAGVTLAFTMVTSLLNAQPYERISGEANPLGGKTNPLSSFSRERYASPDMVDIDNDGDLDVFVGDTLGNIVYYENNGDFTFTELTGAENPFDGIDVGDEAIPRLVDIDNDLDYDAFIGANDGTIKFYENIGSQNVPVFDEKTGAENPFDGVDVNSYASPSFVDIDDDGDYDAFLGNKEGTLLYYENTGDNEVPVMIARTGTENPANNIDLGSASNPVFGDLDNDGDYDILVGDKYEEMHYFENTGTKSAGVFQEITGLSAPFANALLGQNLVPELVDIDGDNDLDAFIGNYSGEIKYYNNEGTASAYDFVPYEPIDVGEFSNADFVDIDNDGDYDAFLTALAGDIYYFKNLGTNTSPSFRRMVGIDNPFDDENTGYNASVEFVDINDDGDFDAFVGNGDGSIAYYSNDGDAGTPLFNLQSGANNPLDGVMADSSANVTFVDIDNDEDMDAFIGNLSGELMYYMNNGSKTVPIFVELTGTDNPFNGITLGKSSSPEFADIDEDGDYDALIGSKSELHYYDNIGTASSPDFSKIASENSPFESDQIYFNFTPAFVDIDGDSDLDLFFGQYTGNVAYYENQAINVSTGSLSISGLTVYPNPASDALTISMKEAITGAVNIRITSLTGQDVLSRSFTANGSVFETSLNVDNLAGGIYILAIENGSKKAIQKIVVK